MLGEFIAVQAMPGGRVGLYAIAISSVLQV
jgi:hypothetical protein